MFACFLCFTPQYVATFDNFAVGNYLLLEHEGLPVHSQVTVLCGRRQGSLLQAVPSHRHHKGCDWFFNKKMNTLTYLGKNLMLRLQLIIMLIEKEQLNTDVGIGDGHHTLTTLSSSFLCEAIWKSDTSENCFSVVRLATCYRKVKFSPELKSLCAIPESSWRNREHKTISGFIHGNLFA